MTGRPETVTVRPLRAEDRAQWAALWRAYLAFYETSVSAQVERLAFDRMLSGAEGEFRGLVAARDGRLVGLAHYLFHRHGWRVEKACYLQDLYAAPEVRGQGVGRALIEAVYAAGDAEGAPGVWWLTQSHNDTARRLYDRIGRLTPFIRYDRR